jgi:hypothetical protein
MIGNAALCINYIVLTNTYAYFANWSGSPVSALSITIFWSQLPRGNEESFSGKGYPAFEAKILGFSRCNKKRPLGHQEPYHPEYLC